MFKERLEHVLKKELQQEVALESSPDPSFGDFALACFPFAKTLKKNPASIAVDFQQRLDGKLPPFIERTEVRGAYLNFFLNPTAVAREITTQILKEKARFGRTARFKGRTAVIEFASPNTNKPLHLGHIRNICLGVSLSALLESQGNRVVRANIVNDRGIHICKAMLAYQLFGDKKTPASEGRKSDHFVGDYYVLFAKHVEQDETLNMKAQELLQRWEQDDKNARTLWKKLNKWCEDGFEVTYKRLEVAFDRMDYESDIWKEGKSIVEQGLKKGVFKKDETGAIVAPLEQRKMPDKVLMRSDGTTLYITQDLYLAVSRQKDHSFDEMIYVVGSEQNLHFQQLFAVFDLLGLAWAKKCVHFSYGMVYLPEGRMKSREGTVVDADDIIQKLDGLAREEILKRDNTLREKELRERSRIIGLGALKFMMLKVDAQRDMTFDQNESISFEGDTGPYVQYAYARCAAILRKAKEQKIPRGKAPFTTLSSEERQLVTHLSRFSDTVKQAADHKKPHLLAQYLLELTRVYNTFYHACPVLQAEDTHVRSNRLTLVSTTKQVIANGLALLGIRTLERM